MNKRGCYCELWETNPSALEKDGIPEGFCSFCEKCGKPGHLRHFPGSAPYTGGWCDHHYRLTAWTHPMGTPGSYVWLAAIALAAYIFWVL